MPKKAPSLPWKVVPYIAPSGRCDVLDYLEDLRDRKRRSYEHFEIIRAEMEARGPFNLGGQYWEAVGDQLYEISWGRNRAYCSVEDNRIVVMYVTVLKLWKKMRASDRRLCLSRRADFQTIGSDLKDGYDLEKRELLYRAYRQKRGKQ